MGNEWFYKIVIFLNLRIEIRFKIKINYVKKIHFLGKNLITLLRKVCIKLSSRNNKLTPRDNSIIFIKDLIGLNVCDLDVELNFYICVAAYVLVVCSTNFIYMI